MTGARPARLPRRALHGVLLLDKPVGMSSHDALQAARRLLNADKAGHTGTLDPLASGLLPLCMGAATKFAQACLDADKRYRATLRLGERTTGGDAEGAVIERRPVRVDGLQLQQALRAFVGAIDQVPPMQSALKKDGRPLYAYAREGVVVERQPRRVTIHALDLVRFDGDEVEIDVSCSKGTYIRTLAEDIGERLGCGAHLRALRRTGAGQLKVADAVSLDDLQRLDATAREALLRPVDELLATWPQIELADADASRFLQGLSRRVTQPDVEAVRVRGPQGFLGTGRLVAGELHPVRVLSAAEIQGLTGPTTTTGHPAANTA